jgi:hypothetical protein
MRVMDILKSVISITWKFNKVLQGVVYSIGTQKVGCKTLKRGVDLICSRETVEKSYCLKRQVN